MSLASCPFVAFVIGATFASSASSASAGVAANVASSLSASANPCLAPARPELSPRVSLRSAYARASAPPSPSRVAVVVASPRARAVGGGGGSKIAHQRLARALPRRRVVGGERPEVREDLAARPRRVRHRARRACAARRARGVDARPEKSHRRVVTRALGTRAPKSRRRHARRDAARAHTTTRRPSARRRAKIDRRRARATTRETRATRARRARDDDASEVDEDCFDRRRDDERCGGFCARARRARREARCMCVGARDARIDATRTGERARGGRRGGDLDARGRDARGRGLGRRRRGTRDAAMDAGLTMNDARSRDFS